jgi:cell pole-organizing protein PopZ
MAQAPSSTPAESGSAAEPDPSMDDILASIRRILNDDDKTAKTAADGVLVLDPSMIVEEAGSLAEGGNAPEQAETVAAPVPATERSIQPEIERPTLATPGETVHSDLVIDEPPFPAPISVARDAPAGAAPNLVAPAAAAAAATSVGALMRTLAAERSAAVSRGVVTIEDLVREEIRPLLKAWLDNHLPPLVERLVQAEIERVVGRNAG